MKLNLVMKCLVALLAFSFGYAMVDVTLEHNINMARLWIILGAINYVILYIEMRTRVKVNHIGKVFRK